MDKRGGIKIFRRNILISQCRKHSQGNTFVMCFIKLPLAEKIMDKRGGIKTFRRRIFVSQCRKPSQLNAFVLCLTKLPVAKKIMVESGVTRFSVTNFSFHSAEKFLRGTLRCCV